MHYGLRKRVILAMLSAACASGSAGQSLKTVSDGPLTITYIEPIFVRPGLSFSAAFAVGGSMPAVPDRIQISFATGRRGGYDFERNRTLTLLLDQETTLALGMMEYDPQNNMVRLFIPRATFERIVASRSISGQVGDAAFVLDESAHTALRTLQTSL